MTVEDIIPKDETSRVVADKPLRNKECLSNPFGLGLLRIGDADAKLRTVLQELPEGGESLGVEIRRISRTPASMSVESG